eukprot:NODE_4839_length_734_cov_1.710049_g4677_i0.p1 GENE.NODE_4839_length_734_cov_1.710049_g4677_i0~~NODE_4839_length_734_cov_1.710049_g4677_i0.p1  ORF type:complete len:221 (+),score=58.78 NODE_4839_length_734_cov_1.710049_g4677_i0:47-709(+)
MSGVCATVQWQHKKGGCLDWEDYSPLHNSLLEDAFQNNPTGTLTIASSASRFEVSFEAMKQTNTKDRLRVRAVRRVPISNEEKLKHRDWVTHQFMEQCTGPLRPAYDLLLGPHRTWEGSLTASALRPASRFSDWGYTGPMVLLVLGVDDGGLVVCVDEKEHMMHVGHTGQAQALVPITFGTDTCHSGLLNVRQKTIVGRLAAGQGTQGSFSLTLVEDDLS